MHLWRGSLFDKLDQASNRLKIATLEYHMAARRCISAADRLIPHKIKFGRLADLYGDDLGDLSWQQMARLEAAYRRLEEAEAVA